MTKKREEIPDWVLWLWDKGHVVLIITVLAAGVLFAGYYLDQRITGIESQLVQTPPPSYQLPELDQFDPGNVTADQLGSRRMVYVPVYSHIYYQGGSAYPLETTLSIRNVDPEKPMYVKSVTYFDTSGKLAKTFVDRLIKLEPLQTIEFLVERRDSTGGSGANFLVDWGSEAEVDDPLIETVMVGSVGTQAIAFARNGVDVTPSQRDP